MSSYSRTSQPLLVVVLILLTGCQLAGPDEGGLWIETDRVSYEAGQDIAVTIQNDGHSVFVNHCCGQPFIGLDSIDMNGVWTEVRPPVGFCIALCDGSPMMLESGDVRHARITVTDAGRYRLWILFGHSRTVDEITESVVSDEFTVVAR